MAKDSPSGHVATSHVNHRRYKAAADASISSNPNPRDHEAVTNVIAAKDWASPVIVLITSSIAAALSVLSSNQLTKDGGSKQEVVPETIFAGFPSTYHAFVVSITFAFSCAFSAMFLDKRPWAARALRLSAIIWLSSASLLFVHVIFFNRLS